MSWTNQQQLILWEIDKGLLLTYIARNWANGRVDQPEEDDTGPLVQLIGSNEDVKLQKEIQ